LTAGSIEAKGWKEVRIVINVPFEPLTYLPDGSLTGFEVKLTNAVCAEIKVK
jgi:ABC-type amino acid transport substrate-binding protein